MMIIGAKRKANCLEKKNLVNILNLFLGAFYLLCSNIKGIKIQLVTELTFV